MILYFANRKMKILGQATTTLPAGYTIVDDLKIEEIETGCVTFECTIKFDNSSRKTLEKMTEAGNYLLRHSKDSNEFYTIIDTEIDTKNQSIYIYAEDAGLDLINEIAEPFAAPGSFTSEYYINKWITDSGFEIGINEIPETSTRKLIWDGEATVAERLASIATQFGNYEISFSFDIKGMEITNKYVNIYAERGKNISEQLRLNRDIDRITIKKSVANLATALKITGATPENSETPVDLKGYNYDDGDFYVDENGILKCRSAVEKWSRYVWNKEPNKLANGEGHIVAAYSWDFVDRDELVKHGITRLKKIYDTEVNYEVDIAKLPSNISVGDRVNIVDDIGEIYLSSRILVLETSVTGGTTKATLGEFLIKDSGTSAKVEEMAAQFAAIVKTANNASYKASAAQTMASDAHKVATNFMEFDDNSGLIIGNLQAVELGKNVLIDSDSIQFRQSSDVLADFTPSKIELGKNSRTSIIDLCNGAGNVTAKTSGYTKNTDVLTFSANAIHLNTAADSTVPELSDTGSYGNIQIDSYAQDTTVYGRGKMIVGRDDNRHASVEVNVSGNETNVILRAKGSDNATGGYPGDNYAAFYPALFDIRNNVKISQYLKVTGETTLSDLSVTGATTLSALSVTGTTTLSERLYLANGKGIWAKNAAGTGNLSVIGATASDHIMINGEGRNNYSNTYLDGNVVYIRTNTGTEVQGGMTVKGGLTVNSAATLTERLYLANNKGVWARNVLDIGDIQLIGLNSSDNVLIGNSGYENANSDTYLSGNSVYLRANNGISVLSKLNIKSKAVIGNNNSYAALHTDGITEMSLALLGGANDTFFAHGSYTNYIGNAYYEGNNIFMRSNNGISLSGTSFKYNNTDVSLDGHTHRNLYYTDGIGGVTWVTSGGAYYLRPADSTNTYYFGSQNFRWDTIYAKNALNTSSDLRLKKDFSTDYEKYIAMLDLIEPTTFVRTNTTDGKRHTGYIAQKVLKAMKDVGLAEADFAGFSKAQQADGTAYVYGLAYEEFIPILHAKIKQLENRIAQLEQKGTIAQ